MTAPDTLTIDIPLSAAGERLDKALAGLVPDLSRSRLRALIAEGRLSGADGALTEPALKLKGGETVTLSLPAPRPAEPEAQDIPLDIRFEDEDLMVIDKPVGLVVHPAPGSPDGTLVNALLAHCGGRLPGINGVERPGIVHRIDKDTSGLIVVAKTERAQRGLQIQFAEHTIQRVYTAFVWGVPRPAGGTIEGEIGRSPVNRRKMAIVSRGGKSARTHYDLEAAYGDMAAKLACRLETGRTHQIRVHLTSRGHPLIGDPLYGKGRQALRKGLDGALVDAIAALPGQALHAGRLGFRHPVGGEDLVFESPLPTHLTRLEAGLAAMKTTTK